MMAHYFEFLVRGDDRDLTAYLSGYAAAGGGAKPLIFAHEAGFHIKGLRERIKHHGEVCHVITDAAHRAWLRTALAAATPRYDFEIREERKIERAYFHFAFDTPSRKVAESIKQVLASLPAGVAARDYTPEEIVDPKARGAEVYAPEHEYVFRGKGVIEGDVPGVVDARAALLALDFTTCVEIDVHHAA
jgi:hypothetical protein